MVDRQWSRRLCRRHHRRDAHAAISRAADCAVDPPLGRRLVFAKADATLMDGSDQYPLFSQSLGRRPDRAAWSYWHRKFLSRSHGAGVDVSRSAAIASRQGSGWSRARIRTWLGWCLHPVAGDTTASLSLRLTLLANNRDHNGETWEDGFQPALSATGDTLRVADGTRFTLHCALPVGEITPQRDWYRNFELPMEAARGLGSRDAHLCVGEAELVLRPGMWCGIVASLHRFAGPDRDRNDIAAALAAAADA